MPCQSYRNPALVETIITALTRWHGEDKTRRMLASGLYADTLFWALPRDDWEWERIERILIDALNSDDFMTVPKINGPVRAVRLRYGDRIPDTPIQNIEGVEFFTHTGIVPGDRVLLRLLPPSLDPESALTNFLTVKPDATKEEALNAVHDRFPDFTPYAFERLWPQARKAAGLPPKGEAGRRPKK
jgi:hypothetical protein